ncbi:hypothetical protein AO965_30235 [Pseudomonas aeruginosa]|nr:hypothetical protein AO965_30235 [Pseudomonas aeruginosa]OPE26472.1 hypothetical protein APB11_31660 [Pseudomonas aeruginosa]RTX00885.1 hypothetical protein DZA16_33410 [Pseudomonas aeruginosa]
MIKLITRPIRDVVRRWVREELALAQAEEYRQAEAHAERLLQNRPAREPNLSDVVREPLAAEVAAWLKENPASPQAVWRERRLARAARALRRGNPSHDEESAICRGCDQ